MKYDTRGDVIREERLKAIVNEKRWRLGMAPPNAEDDVTFLIRRIDERKRRNEARQWFVAGLVILAIWLYVMFGLLGKIQ